MRWPLASPTAARFLAALCTAGFLFGLATSATAQDSSSRRFSLSVTVGGAAVEWVAEAPASRNDEVLMVPAAVDRARVSFPGGWLDLAVADAGTFDYAHVLAVEVQRTAEGTYRFSTTVRHRDEGWEHYADVWRVVGENVANGDRILTHPHDSEQPFTRSQSDVDAAGTIRVEASGSVHGLGGSVIALNLDEIFAGDAARVFSIAYELTKPH